mgnify:CR=1 FL=1|jgi:hypothetical protein
MENPFKKILHQEELPKKLKGKIMSDISFIKLTIDAADLLVVKYPGIIENLLRIKEEK